MRFDPSTAKPREVEAFLRSAVLESFGNKVEDKATINSSHGFYNVYITQDDKQFNFLNFRKKDAPRIAKAIAKLNWVRGG